MPATHPRILAFGLLAGFSVLASTAQARTVCTLIADASDGRHLLEQGDCATRVTPASTFKIPLAVMGFDAGVIKDAHAPRLPFKKGYADWGGEEWRQPTDPERWLKYSVVWYSQHIARDLGADELTRYGKGFGYGNADFSGDPGKNNGLERSWISSSLKISPVEQVAFLRRLVNGALPVKPDAVEKTRAVVERFDAGDGWMLQGKTGSAFPRKADGTLDRTAGWGWFVGWAEKDGRRYVFARLDQDEKREPVSGGLRARDAVLKEWGGLIGGVR